MRKSIYPELKEKTLKYLYEAKGGLLVKRLTIRNDLQLNRSQIARVLRELRKEKKVWKTLGRWGLTHETYHNLKESSKAKG